MSSIACFALALKHGLPGAEADLSSAWRADIDRCCRRHVHGIQACAGLHCSLVRLLRAVAGLGSVLVGLGGLGVGLADTFLGAGIDVLDLLGIGRSQSRVRSRGCG